LVSFFIYIFHELINVYLNFVERKSGATSSKILSPTCQKPVDNL